MEFPPLFDFSKNNFAHISFTPSSWRALVGDLCFSGEMEKAEQN
jgi:hypothetical protein